MLDVEQSSQPPAIRLTPGIALCNFYADAAPTTSDDETKGYSENSVWYKSDTPPLRMWKCVDATEGAANWVELHLTFNGLQIGITFVDGSSGNFLYNNGGQLGSINLWQKVEHIAASFTINLNSAAEQDAFTIPSGVRFILTKCAFRDPTSDITDEPESLSLLDGSGAAADEMFLNASGLDAANKRNIRLIESMAIYEPGETVTFQMSGAIGAAKTLDVDIFGYFREA